MVYVTARIKLKGKHFEVKVDLDEALKFKRGEGDIISALDCDSVYYDLRKGEIASESDIQDAFGTKQLYEVAEKIIKQGEVQKTQEFRDAEQEKKVKKVADIILRNAVDQNGNPYTEERLRNAINDIHFNFDNRPAEKLATELVHKLKEIIPIKIETKKIKLTIPAQFTGQVYGLLKDYKEKENWLSNGNLEVIINIPSGLQIDFYESLNNATHGAVQSEELSDN